MIGDRDVYTLTNGIDAVNYTREQDEYFSGDLWKWEGMNPYSIANTFNISTEMSNDIYDTYEDLDVLQGMKSEIPKRLDEIVGNPKFKKYIYDLMIYYKSIDRKVNDAIIYYRDEIDNYHYCKNLKEKYTYREPARFNKAEQISFFGDIEVDKKKKAKDNLEVVATHGAKMLLHNYYKQKYIEEHQGRLC